MQVIRNGRLREGAPGTTFIAEETTQWKQRLRHFWFKRKANFDASGEGKRKRKKVQDKVPRLASFDVLQALQNALDGHCQRGLEYFLPDGVPKCLTIVMDQDSKNWCGFWFLRNKLRLMVDGVMDPFHRRSNDMSAAIGDAGLRLTVAKGHLCNNIVYGPWQGGAYIRDLEEAAMDISEGLSPHDPLVLHMWPMIMADRDVYNPEDMGTEARTEFLKSLPVTKAFRLKGNSSDSPHRQSA